LSIDSVDKVCTLSPIETPETLLLKEYLRVKRLVAALPVLAATVLASGCGGASDEKGGSSGGDGSNEQVISLVAYSTPQVVYDEIIPDFRQTEAGKGLSVKTSFGPSGEQSRAVAAGLRADVVTFSIEPDVTRLVKAGLVPDGWKAGANRGVATTSLVTFIVRKGNPKNIKSWQDLLRPGIEVITPSPLTSGAAKWNLLGAYAHGGLPYVETLVTEHVEVQPKSGREALQTFIGGKGDVLLSYEYEATTAQKKGEDVAYVIPDDTLRIDINIATTTDAPAVATTFVEYVLGEEAQQRFADWGYRPVNSAVLAANAAKFPTPRTLKTIDDLGGWAKVDAELFDPESGAISKILEKVG
jgi:sulfate/thiosulfate transport system substrate-binding protein